MQHPALVLVIAGLFAAIASPALAQEIDPPQPDPRRLFEQGQTAYDQGDYEAAIGKWVKAYELDPMPLIQYNLSQAYERLGRLSKAVEALERYLDAAEPDDPNQANARARLSSLRDRLEGTGIRITGAPEGAKIMVDGESWGRTPRPDPIQVEPGSHQVELTLEGHEAFRSTVVAPAGQVAEVEVAMRPSAEPSDAQGPAPDESTGAGDAPPPADDGGVSVVAWVLVGVGGAAIVGGAVAGGLALGESGASNPDEGKARTLGKTADGLLWPGLAIAGAGVVWAIVDGGGGESAGTADVRVTPYIGRAGAGVGARGRF